MREVTDAARVASFMKELASSVRTPTRVYFTGGTTAVLLGWRSSTIDVDVKIVPESDAVLKAIPALKERLRVNVEFAAPDQFIPELPGWRDRSAFIATEGQVSFFHYDFYAQALAKLERRHAIDLDDVQRMLASGLIEKPQLRRLFEAIEPELHRFPAVDPGSFRRAVGIFLTS
jgi:hypothetical protein